MNNSELLLTVIAVLVVGHILFGTGWLIFKVMRSKKPTRPQHETEENTDINQ